jgi:hypothetical protein
LNPRNGRLHTEKTTEETPIPNFNLIGKIAMLLSALVIGKYSKHLSYNYLKISNNIKMLSFNLQYSKY